MRFIGLDLHKQSMEVCILCDRGNLIARHTVACERFAIQEFAKKHLKKSDRLAVEATTNTWAVAEILRSFVDKVVVGNPLQIKAIAQAKVKTDKIDAMVLANLLRCDFLPEVWEPDAKTLKMRHITAIRSALITDRTRLKNRIHSVLAGLLIVLPQQGLFTKQGRAWLDALELPDYARQTVDQFLRLYDAVEAEIESHELLLQQLAHHDAQVRLLMTLPGVAHGVAMTLISALGDISRFRDGDHAASYLGLTPVIRQSGGKCYKGAITKAGCSTTRAMLTQAAQSAASHPGPLGAFFRRLKKRKAHNVAIVATARKLVTIAFLMLKNNEPYRYAIPGNTRAKLRQVQKAAESLEEGSEIQERANERDEPKDILNRIYARRGLPQSQGPEQWSAGEKRALQEAGVQEFADSVHASPPRKGPKPKLAVEPGLKKSRSKISVAQS